MDTRHPDSHYLGGRLKPWWRQIQASQERRAREEADEDEEDDQ
jgi:hypothetical protein